MNEFEKESATMDMKEEMMSDAVDDVMDDEVEDEEAEGDKILREVLDEIGIGLQQQLNDTPTSIASNAPLDTGRQAVALGASDGPSLPTPRPGAGADSRGGGGGAMTDEEALQARLDNLRR